MNLLFTKSTAFLLVFSLVCTFFVFLFLCIQGTSTTFSDTNGLEQVIATANKPLLAGEKIQGSFRPLYSHLGIVSVRFTNFGKINSDSVVFRIKEKNNSAWIYENTYKVDQFQPDQFFTFGFPIQPNSSNRVYSFEIQSQSGQKGDAIGLSGYKPTLRLTYAFPKSSLFSHPSYILEIMRYRMLQKLTQTLMQALLIGIFISTFLLLFGMIHLNEVKNHIGKNKKVYAYPLFYLKHHPLLFIIFFGLLLRFLLALGPFSADTNAFWHESLYPQHHIWNVYAHSNEHGYNYSPLIFFVFVALAGIKNILHIFSWPFLWRTFLSLFDLGTLFVLIQLAKLRKISPIRTALLFFLNPISIVLSGYHGQFENVAIFFLLLAVLLHYKTINVKQPKLFLKWICVTIGLLVKHIVIYQLLVFWRSEVKKKSTILLLFSLSILVFLASFVPFWSGAQKLIINNVFLYGGLPGYGIAYFFTEIITYLPFLGQWGTQIYKLIFIFFLLVTPVFITRKDLARNILFMFLFFLTFTPGISVQYFVLPIAVGTLFPTKWFYLYNILVGFFIVVLELVGFGQVLPSLTILQFFPVEGHITWVLTALWFISELFYLSKTSRKLYQSLFFPSFRG